MPPDISIGEKPDISILRLHLLPGAVGLDRAETEHHQQQAAEQDRAHGSAFRPIGGSDLEAGRFAMGPNALGDAARGSCELILQAHSRCVVSSPGADPVLLP